MPTSCRSEVCRITQVGCGRLWPDCLPDPFGKPCQLSRQQCWSSSSKAAGLFELNGQRSVATATGVSVAWALNHCVQGCRHDQADNYHQLTMQLRVSNVKLTKHQLCFYHDHVPAYPVVQQYTQTTDTADIQTIHTFTSAAAYDHRCILSTIFCMQQLPNLAINSSSLTSMAMGPVANLH